MYDIIFNLFGAYTPVLDPITESVVPGVAGVDWPWLSGVLLFAIMLFSVLRLIGVVLKK